VSKPKQAPAAEKPSNVINIMDALRKSLSSERKPARSKR
jgi:non-homologous end joining protein Ku